MRTFEQIGYDIVWELIRILRDSRPDDIDVAGLMERFENFEYLASATAGSRLCQDSDEQVQETMQIIRVRLKAYLGRFNGDICRAVLMLHNELEQMLPVTETTVGNALVILNRIRSVEGAVTIFEVLNSFGEFSDQTVTSSDEGRAARLVEFLLSQESFVNDFDLKGALDRTEDKIRAMARIELQ